jgi:DNA-binding response OmpR family regulator
MMPRIDGAQVLLHRQKYDLAANTRIVVLTAKTGHADEVWCWEHGADEFLNKPFDADQLTRLVGQLMNMSPEDLEHRREVGLADARRMDALHAAFQVKPVR